MRHVIENEKVLVEVMDIGATLTRFIKKKNNQDFVLGFDTDQGYIDNNGTNIGASIGRNCNRIGNARFSLNGKEYQLSVNNNMNQLHGGGVNGFAFKTWNLKNKTNDELVFEYDSLDLEEGFPGNLHAEVSYKLEDNSLIITFTGTSDADTIFNMTNHSYFNLGADTIKDHELRITTDKYSPVDEYSLTLDEVKDVKGTGFDFVNFTRIGKNLEIETEGIDNNYVWENMDDKLMAELKYNDNKLNVYSDLPDMHLYTAYWLDNCIGKYNKQYGRFGAVCLECQFYPNAINYDNYIKPILKKGEISKHYIRFEIEN